MSVHPFEHCAEQLAEQWHTEADALRLRGQTGSADMADSFAHELKTAVGAWLDELLTMREASEFGGYAYSTLEHRLRVGQLPNAGELGSPRLRRRDVPIKVDRPPTRFGTAGVDVDDLDQLLGTIDG